MAGRSVSTHCIAAFIALALPLLVSFVKSDDQPQLTGIVISTEKPELKKESWLDGSFQKLRDDYNADHWAFKELMVRTNNQLYYQAFNQIRVKGFVIGKDDYVFSESYIFSAFGDDLVPETRVVSLLEKARVVQDSLKRKGIDLLLVYAPGKGAGCREFVEDKYVHPVKRTNHDQFVSQSNRLGLNYLDLYTYFELMKPKSPHPLFPRFGHHWSYYGECLAVDTIISHIEHLHHSDIPDIGWNRIDVVDSARSRDADVLESMNLLNDPPQRMKLAYPAINVENNPEKNTTRVLTISDSYWYGPVYMGVPQNCFAGGQFWYYCNKVVPSPRPGEKVEVWELDFKKEIESYNVIMILYSDGNLPFFGNNFIPDAYELYTNPTKFAARAANNRQVQVYVKQIRESPVLLKKATKYSETQQITLDSAIREDAMRRAGLIAGPANTK
jgi:hypothetical protein